MTQRSILLSILMIAFVAASSQQKFTIQGKLSGLKEPSKVMLSYREDRKLVRDSAIPANGSFTFTGKVKKPVTASLTLVPMNNKAGSGMRRPLTPETLYPLNHPSPEQGMFGMTDQQQFYLDAGTIKVKGSASMKDASIKAGKAQDDYLLLQSQLKPLQDKMSPLSAKMRQYMQEKNETAGEQLFPQLRAIRMEMNKVEDAFIYKHPDSYVSLDLVKNKSVVIDPATFEPFYNSLSKGLRDSEDGKEMARKLAIAKKLDVGQPFMNFTLNTTEGTPVSLQAFKGKYVLVDFWASWCGPCRMENPNVLKAYNAYKDKNFDVVAISLDDKKEAWLKAIKEDGMPWVHVSDLQGFDSPVAKEYGIEAIPQNFLLDPSGKIIAKQLRGDQLINKLTEILK